MRNVFIGSMVFMAMTLAGALGVASQDSNHDAAYRQAREQMADMLASEDFNKVDFAASSFDRAMELIYTAVDTYLDRAVPALGGVETARKFGIHILQGLNDHKIHWADEDGYDLAGKRYLLVSDEADAGNLGELLARVAILIHSANGGVGVDIRRAAKKIFEGMLPVEGSGQPLVTQYLVRLRSLSGSDRKALLDFALE